MKETEPKWVTDYNNQSELNRIARKSAGYQARILSRYEGILETVVDQIRSAPTSRHAIAILSKFIAKFFKQ